MSKKFIAVIFTVVSATLCFSATSAFAVNNKVHVIKECESYDDQGNKVSRLIPDYYRVVQHRVFHDGDEGVKVWSHNRVSGQYRKVNISARCLESHGGLVTFY